MVGLSPLKAATNPADGSLLVGNAGDGTLSRISESGQLVGRVNDRTTIRLGAKLVPMTVVQS